MTDIIIGKDYGGSFDGVLRLICGGCAPDDVRTDGNGGIIRGDYIFRRADGSGIDAADGESAGMNAHSGASWFASLRGERRDNGLALWKDLVETVREYFHKYNSLTDYGMPIPAPDEKERRRVSERVYRLAELFFPSTPDSRTDVRDLGRGALYEYYGVNVRAELGEEAGDPVPVLAKMYFRRTDRGLMPVTGGEARDIERAISSVKSDKAPTRGEPFPDTSRAISDVFTAVLRAAEANGLGDYMYLARECDRNAAGSLVSRLATGADKLRCTALRVLGITRMQLPVTAYEIVCGGVTAARVGVSATGRVNMTCAACGVPLISNGCIECDDEETGGRTTYEVDLFAEDFGIGDSDDMAYIARYSAFGRHQLPNDCKNVRCRRRICTDRQVIAGGRSERSVCRDCPYPEVVFVAEDGKLLYTPDTVFARDRMTLIPSEETGRCADCGRTFSASSLVGRGTNRLCEFCRNATNAVNARSGSARKLYRRYSGMLGYGVRLKHLFGRKYCFDDEDITLFVLGKDRYILDKTAVNDTGFIDKPRRAD